MPSRRPRKIRRPVRRPRAVRRRARRRRPLNPAIVQGAAFASPPVVRLPPPEFPEIADPKKRAYLVGYVVGGGFAAAAAAAGVSMRTGWNWRHDADDALFLEAFRVAQGMAGDRMEAEIVRRAYEGVTEPVYQGGKLVGTKRSLSDTLLIFWAKANLRKYREQVEHSGPKGGPIPVSHTGKVMFYLPDNLRSARP